MPFPWIVEHVSVIRLTSRQSTTGGNSERRWTSPSVERVKEVGPWAFALVRRGFQKRTGWNAAFIQEEHQSGAESEIKASSESSGSFNSPVSHASAKTHNEDPSSACLQWLLNKCEPTRRGFWAVAGEVNNKSNLWVLLHFSQVVIERASCSRLLARVDESGSEHVIETIAFMLKYVIFKQHYDNWSRWFWKSTPAS